MSQIAKSTFQGGGIFSKWLLAAGSGLALCFSIGPIQANPEQVLHAFDGVDGANPYAPLIQGAGQSFYGTTYRGGAFGFGVVFKLARDGTLTVLHDFAGGDEGANPLGGLLPDGEGNLYGTASDILTSQNSGVIFEIAPDGTETVLHSFSDPSEGVFPVGELIRDADGNFYGTTEQGGAYGRGVVFQLAPDGTYTVLHSFAGGKNDGSNPYSGVVRDPEGNLYGTLSKGGAYNEGLVYKLAPDGGFTVLHAFLSANGVGPYYGTLIRDAAGNLYGTTPNGGAYLNGVVYKVAPDGTETVLYSFRGRKDGGHPNAGLEMDAAGNLYGTAHSGGSRGFGVVFKLAADGTYTMLHSFAGGNDGGYPYARPILGANGTLYGTTSGGTGEGDFGTVYRVKN